VKTIYEHPSAQGVAFLGTEHTLFISLNAAERWTRLAANLPTTRYDDILVHPRDRDLSIEDRRHDRAGSPSA
jgi:hypothetical protein